MNNTGIQFDMHEAIVRNHLCQVSVTLIFLISFKSLASASTTLPPRKPGFWVTSTTLEMNGKILLSAAAPLIIADCSNLETDDLLKKMTAAKSHCLKFQLTGSNNVYTINSTCALPQIGVADTHAMITFVGDSIETDIVDIKSPTFSEHIEADSKWVGACPTGLSPGDKGVIVNGVFRKIPNALSQ
jgi:hypothetical protein